MAPYCSHSKKKTKGCQDLIPDRTNPLKKNEVLIEWISATLKSSSMTGVAVNVAVVVRLEG